MSVTLDEIKLTTEQEKLLTEMLREALSKPTPLKQTVYFQKHVKKIWEAAQQAHYEEMRQFKPFLHWCMSAWDGLLIDEKDPEFECCTCFPKDANGKPKAT